MKSEISTHRKRAEKISMMWSLACILTFSVGVLAGMIIVSTTI